MRLRRNGNRRPDRTAGKTFAVDPGASGTGWALFGEDGGLEAWGVISPPRSLEWREKCRYVLSGLLRAWRGARNVYVEEPSAMSGVRGLATSGGGSLVKLAMLVGMIVAEFGAETVGVTEWKGQLPKEVVAARVEKRLPGAGLKSHAIDAAGIGLYKLGRF